MALRPISKYDFLQMGLDPFKACKDTCTNRPRIVSADSACDTCMGTGFYYDADRMAFLLCPICVACPQCKTPDPPYYRSYLKDGYLRMYVGEDAYKGLCVEGCMNTRLTCLNTCKTCNGQGFFWLDPPGVNVRCRCVRCDVCSTANPPPPSDLPEIERELVRTRSGHEVVGLTLTLKDPRGRARACPVRGYIQLPDTGKLLGCTWDLDGRYDVLGGKEDPKDIINLKNFIIS